MSAIDAERSVTFEWLGNDELAYRYPQFRPPYEVKFVISRTRALPIHRAA
ncbi:MAG: hypothetical protein R2911_38635 [Caldilineaceae bacterium]